jgi:hypothetical protein
MLGIWSRREGTLMGKRGREEERGRGEWRGLRWGTNPNSNVTESMMVQLQSVGGVRYRRSDNTWPLQQGETVSDTVHLRPSCHDRNLGGCAGARLIRMCGCIRVTSKGSSRIAPGSWLIPTRAKANDRNVGSVAHCGGPTSKPPGRNYVHTVYQWKTRWHPAKNQKPRFEEMWAGGRFRVQGELVKIDRQS